MKYLGNLRVKGFFIALLIGALVCLALAFAVQANWYPGPLFWADGGIQGLENILMVELVLGPVLTAYLLSSQKATHKIKLDIVVIIFLQLLTLSTGTYIVYTQRPAMIIYSNGRFHTIAVSALTKDDKSLSILKGLGAHLPVWLYPESELGVGSNINFVPANLRWEDIQFGTHEEIQWQLNQNHPNISAAINGIPKPDHIVILDGRYQTFLADVDHDFHFLNSSKLKAMAAN